MKDFKLTLNSLGLLVTELTKLLKSTNKSYRVSVVEWREKRSLSQNALYWKWLTEIDQQNPLKVDGSKIQGNELWHEVFKKYYCPTKNITNGGNTLPVKSTKMLDVGEMTFYLNRIEQWCIDRGIVLTIPETSEYYQLMQSQIR
ncbi:hypothetical protein [Vibrio phage vB_ValP_FGH]|nr:hypothetical protein [Vibrio phage vB_ValP_FGH]